MNVTDNIALVREKIAKACAKVGRTPDTVKLIAVSKTHPSEYVLDAIADGVQHFGENRVEESAIKIPEVIARTNLPVTWHMIGHIQSRKVKDVVSLFHWIHSIDSVKLAQKLSVVIGDEPKILDVLLEINVSGEESKSGFSAHGWQQNSAIRDRLVQNISEIQSLSGLHIHGLMTMAPIAEDVEKTRPVFADLAMLREWLREQTGLPLQELSMGMSDDYSVAVEEGATMVRIGRAIFGERMKEPK